LALQVRALGSGSHLSIANIYRSLGRCHAHLEMWEECLDRFLDALTVEEELNLDRQNWGVAVTAYVSQNLSFRFKYSWIYFPILGMKLELRVYWLAIGLCII
jgi:hypothetical protein